VHGADDRVADPAGIETLPVRMERHVANARRIVAFLREQPMVASIAYPELPDHPDHALAAKLLPRGCGAVFPVDLKATREQGAASSSRCACSRTSPTSATRSRWSSTRRRRRTSA
jgi:O-acetylhomoserine/O-acetylserine sulfhydrylase-like pyridoxal-dependent enzyme